MMKFGSLFSGIGGIDLGLERAGMECAWQVEIDKHARSVLRRHWPDVDLYKDVTGVGGTRRTEHDHHPASAASASRWSRTEPGTLHQRGQFDSVDTGESDASRPDQLVPVDLICGGFPCQDLSVAGRREGLAGERSGLFHEFMRIVGEIAPTWVLIENVPGLLSSNDGRDMATVVGTLAELGYGWSYRVLDSQYFGVAQRRRRVFIVGYLGAPCPPEILFEPESVRRHPRPSRTTGAGAAGSVVKGAAIGREPQNGPQRGEHLDDGTTYTLNATEVHGLIPFDTTQITSDHNRNHPQPGDPSHPRARGAHPPAIAFNIYPASGQGSDLEASPTDLANIGGRYGASERGTRVVMSPKGTRNAAGRNARGDAQDTFVVSNVPRRLTPTECERLQAFPDGHTAWGIRDGERVEISDGPRYRMLGNAVTVNVAEWIGHRIMEVL
jgi:DNA (cytosine-5)-methyltransferase 1